MTLGAPGLMKCTSPLFKLPAVLERSPPGSLLSVILYRIPEVCTWPRPSDMHLRLPACLLCIPRGPAETTRMHLMLSPFLQRTLRALADTTGMSLQLSASLYRIRRSLAQTVGNAAAAVCLPFPAVSVLQPKPSGMLLQLSLCLPASLGCILWGLLSLSGMLLQLQPWLRYFTASLFDVAHLLSHAISIGCPLHTSRDNVKFALFAAGPSN